jgi:hypothetical protein
MNLIGAGQWKIKKVESDFLQKNYNSVRNQGVNENLFDFIIFFLPFIIITLSQVSLNTSQLMKYLTIFPFFQNDTGFNDFIKAKIFLPLQYLSISNFSSFTINVSIFPYIHFPFGVKYFLNCIFLYSIIVMSIAYLIYFQINKYLHSGVTTGIKKFM